MIGKKGPDTSVKMMYESSRVGEMMYESSRGGEMMYESSRVGEMMYGSSIHRGHTCSLGLHAQM
jgi:hypothetical protein